MAKFFLETAPDYLQIMPLDFQIKILVGFIFIGILSYNLVSIRLNSGRFGFLNLILPVFVLVCIIFAITMVISYGVLLVSRFNWSSLVFMIMWLYCALPLFALAPLTFSNLPSTGGNMDDDNLGPPEFGPDCDQI